MSEQNLKDFLVWLRKKYDLCDFVSKDPGYGSDYFSPTFDTDEVILRKYQAAGPCSCGPDTVCSRCWVAKGMPPLKTVP